MFTELDRMNITVVIMDLSDRLTRDGTSAHYGNTTYYNLQRELETLKYDVELVGYKIVDQLFHKKRDVRANEDIDKRPVLYSRPYFDFAGGGEVLTLGQPIFDRNGNVFGAVGIDTALLTRGIRTTANLNLGIFDGRFQSYLFIFDLEGLVIYHPFKPLDLNRPIMYYDVEKAPIASYIQKYFDSNATEIVTHRVLNHRIPVKANYDGTNRVSFVLYNGTYLWKKSEDLFIGIIIFDHEKSAIFQMLSENLTSTGNCTKFDYHSNIDNLIKDTNEWTRLNDKVINFNRVMTMFTVQAYQIDKIVERPESPAEIKTVRECLTDDQCNLEYLPISKTVFDDICSFALLDRLWKTQVETLNQTYASVFSNVYGASPSGLFKIYPGFNMSHKYEPSIRPWFLKAVPSDHLEATTYIDHIWNIPIATLSRSINVGSAENSDSTLRFVIGMDIAVNVLQKLVEKHNENCTRENVVCSLVDKNGVFIVHEDMDRDFIAKNNLYFQEYDIYQDLEENGQTIHGSCHNLEDSNKLPHRIEIKLTYYSAVLDCVEFSIEQLPYLQSFLIVKNVSNRCLPQVLNSFMPQHLVSDGCITRNLSHLEAHDCKSTSASKFNCAGTTGISIRVRRSSVQTGSSWLTLICPEHRFGPNCGGAYRYYLAIMHYTNRQTMFYYRVHPFNMYNRYQVLAYALPS